MTKQWDGTVTKGSGACGNRERGTEAHTGKEVCSKEACLEEAS